MTYAIRRILLSLVAVLVAAPAVAQDCRANLGGQYVFVHSTHYVSGDVSTVLSYFAVGPSDASGGLFDVKAISTHRMSARVLLEDTGLRYEWIDACLMTSGGPTMLGYVSDDGSLIGFVTVTEDQQMSGVAFRTSK